MCVQVREEDETIQTLRPDVYEDSLFLDDLRPSTNYSFLAVVGNSLALGEDLIQLELYTTDYNLKFESFNGGAPPSQRTSSPNPSQQVDSTTPPPRITSPRLTSPLLHSQHYYNSLRKYQLDTLPVARPNEEGSKDRVVEVQIHSNLHSNGVTTGRRNDVDGGHYNRPTSHPPSLPLSPGSQPPPFLPPPSLTTSSTLPTNPQHPSYNHPTSHTLYSVPRKGGNPSHPMQMSMSALPTGDEGRSQVVGSRVSTLPRGATTNGDDYTVMERVEDSGRSSLVETGRRFHSMDHTSTSAIAETNNFDIDQSKRASYKTDV
ncbi:hypothetical protein GBAR_LOCUS8493 [Geodia barretti]|uniref:Uncharacterized protein n=1 Tax=Geodia barretti TaxID=519541 RepID=A0AA35RKV5_GEOBA|nr:hypothetical protein GBAR_LOCUS8493 [Geodia barretti]